ncbi:MAG: hypothetical protein FWC58_09045, partial [Desulfobulbus sp.]|nr:hypothetical protein [Desulfobulbus sp.]
LENLLNALGTQLLGPEQWKTLRGDPNGNTWFDLNDTTHADADGNWVTYAGRNRFYEMLDKLVNSAAYTNKDVLGHLTLTALTPDQTAALKDSAHTDFGAFAALYSLSPFVLAGDGLEAAIGPAWGKLYDDWKEDQGLDAGQTHTSDTWYADRGDFLHYWLKGAGENKTVVDVDNTFSDLPNTDQRVYEQLDSGQKVIVQNGSITGNDNPNTGKDSQYYLFGGNGLDVETGGKRDDHLYGQGGLDVLTGGQGNDYLEGGEGLDLYRFTTGDGQDTVFDSDGKAILQRNGELYVLGTQTGDDTWTGGTGANAFTATRNGNDLILTFTDNANGSAPDSLTLKNFDFKKAATAEGSYGLRLIPDLPAKPNAPLAGDLADWDSDPGKNGIQPQYDDFGNTLRADGQDGRPLIPQPGRADVLRGSGDADWIEGGAGGDLLFGNGGNDVIFADTSHDGSLTLTAAIQDGEKDDGTGSAADLLAGGAGNDTLIGGTGGDLLVGGPGQDILIGGAGNDNLWGDSEIYSASFSWTLERQIQQQANGRLYLSTLINGDWQTSDQYDGTVGSPDLLIGGAGDDWAMGGGGDDLILGGTGNDVLFGEGGDDVLIGGDGEDGLYGGIGNDILDGGAGDDTLLGGGPKATVEEFCVQAIPASVQRHSSQGRAPVARRCRGSGCARRAQPLPRSSDASQPGRPASPGSTAWRHGIPEAGYQMPPAPDHVLEQSALRAVEAC